MDDITAWPGGPIDFGRLRIEETPTFPAVVSIGRVGLRLHADGTAEGDPDALEAALRESKGPVSDMGLQCWLILALLRLQLR